MSTDAKKIALERIETILEAFNRDIKETENSFGLRASFMWSYDADGRRFLKVTDINEPSVLPEDQMNHLVAETKIKVEGATVALDKNDGP